MTSEDLLKKQRMLNGVAGATAPCAYTIGFLLLMLIWRVVDLPSPQEVYDGIVRLYHDYGLVIVAAAAAIEGLVLISLYFPGSGVILIGVAASRGDPTRAVAVVAIVTLAFIVAAQINFVVGYFGLHGLILKMGGSKWLKRAQDRYARNGVYILAPCFVHPNLGGFMSVAAGIGRLQWRKFFIISVASIALWNVFWGFVAYLFAQVVESVATQPFLVLSGLGLWTITAFVWGFLRGE
jgi:membrane protein DedA with SNARE-associated domain